MLKSNEHLDFLSFVKNFDIIAFYHIHYYFKNSNRNENIINNQLNKINYIRYLNKFKKNNFSKIPPFELINYEIKNKSSNYLYNNRNYYNDSEIFEKNEIHSIYGEKCKKCNKLIGEFKFRNYGKLFAQDILGYFA